MNWPNALTTLRLMLVPVFASLYAVGEPRLALVVYLVAAFTDALDGYLARRLNQITSFGKLADPVADKLMQLTMLACLVTGKRVPWWYLAVLVVKELYLMVGSVLLLKRSIVVSANRYGKIATVLGVLSILCLYPWHAVAWVIQAGQVLLYLSLACSLYSTVVYTVNGVKAGRVSLLK